jgi:hypothetical protein
MTLLDFLSGAITLGFLLSGTYFLRFWKRTGDSLFLSLAIAFALLGIGQALLALANIEGEERSLLYLFRLAAFALILFAVVRKNRSAR